MGEREQYQPLTSADKATVVLYRLGIAFSCFVLLGGMYVLLAPGAPQSIENPSPIFTALLAALYVSTGMSVFFIHLYIGSYKRLLKRIYYAALACLAALFFLGGGDPLSVVAGKAWGGLLLVPLALCLGFVAAKEAFCFRLRSGYVSAVLMPLYLVALGGMTYRAASLGFLAITVVFTFFTSRKVFQPLHYDIGDKSAYQP